MSPHEQAWLELTDEVTVRDEPTYRSSEGEARATVVGECGDGARVPSVDPRSLVRGQPVRFRAGDGEGTIIEGVFDRHGYTPALLWIVPRLGNGPGWWTTPQYIVSVGDPPDRPAAPAPKSRRRK